MKKVAVLVSCDSFEGFYGGTFGITRETFLKSYRNDFVWEYSQGLCRCGHDVFIYIFSYGLPAIHKIADRLYVRFLPLPRWLRVVDVFLWRLRKLRHGPSMRDQVAYFAYGRALQDSLRADLIDVLYHQEIWTHRFDIVLHKSVIPVIGADHGAVFADWSEAAKRSALPRAAGLVCQSAAGLNRARRLGGVAVLMPNGVDTSFFMPPEGSRIRPKAVLAVGRLVEEQKRFSDLLRAMQSLPDFTLTLVGSGPDESRLKRLANQIGVHHRITFAGFVSDRAELRRLYQECGVFVSTSSWEAVALVLLEAMSCAAPVVATEIPSFMDLLTDGVDGILVPVGEPEKVAQAILAAHSEQSRLGVKARETVEGRYSSAGVYQQLSTLIENAELP